MIRNAIVMCAGKGLGLLPLTENIPKPCIKILGKSILQRIVEGLKEAGIENIYFVTYHLEKKITKEATVICKKTKTNPFFINQKGALGTADAVKSAKGIISGPFIVASGDHVLDVSIYRDAANAFEGKSLVVLKRVKNPSNYGVAEVENGIIKEMVEKPKEPKTDLANLGIYVFSQDIFQELEKIALSRRNEYEITDALRGKKAFITEKYWLDVGLPWSLLDAMDFLFSIEKQRRIMWKGAIVENTRMEGNVYIGKKSVVRNSEIRDACIGEGCEIEGRISSSLIGDKAKVNSSGISCSIVGNGADIENADLQAKVEAKIATRKGERTSPGKFGSVIGDKAKINGIVPAGSLISKR